MHKYDIIFCSLPYSDLDHIYSAPAILKSVVMENGFTAKTIDFGQTLLLMCDKDIELFNRIQTYYITPGNILTPDEIVILNKFYDYIIQFFKENPCKYIGLSIFSIYTHKPSAEITKLLRDNNINSKIIVGGRGAKVPIFQSIDILDPNPEEQYFGFGKLLLERKLVDHVVIGDGEDAILEILSDKKALVVENRSETFNYPLPNYDDYNFDDYLWAPGEAMFPITGSKGCVRSCDFCDIKFQFGRYRYRTGRDIANEMIYIAETFNFRKFQFTDSLVNGGLKPFREFCTIVSEYNFANLEKKITWNGQYISRLASEMPVDLYQIMADSGAHGLTIGAESGSNNVLTAMNKKTTVEALYSELEQFRKHNITCLLLTFVGHWSETYEDFVKHCEMFINIAPYVRSGTISALTLGNPAYLYPGTPAMDTSTAAGIVMSDFNREIIWINKNNASNTYKERLFRRLVLSKLISRLKIPIIDETTEFSTASSIIELQHKQINKFYNDDK
jgi:hypothetical protein